MILVVIGGAFGNTLRYTETMPDRMADFSAIPNSHAGYLGAEQPLADFAYDVLKADITTLRDYTTVEGERVQLFIAYFKSQEYGSQIHSPKHCLPGGGWRIDNIQPLSLEFQEGMIKEINRLTISAKDYSAVMLYWYETRSGIIRSEYGLKLDLVKNALLLRSTDAVIIRLTIDAANGDVNKATERGVRFLHEFYPFIKRSLPF